MASRIKVGLLAMLVALASTGAADAATFSAKRGLNLDIWTTWPDESRWGDPAAILPFPEWRKSLDAEGLARLRADGFDFVRIPVDPSPFLSPQAAALRSDLLASVLTSVKLVNAAGLKAVVDLHAIPAGGNRSIGTGQILDDPTVFDAYLGLVRDMARTIGKEDPSRVAFELMNEPTAPCSGTDAAAWEDKLKRLFAAARAAATRTTLVLSGACWGTAEGLSALDPKAFPDDNLLWSFHSYEPFVLTHQGASWAGDFIRYVTGLPYPLTAVPRADLDAAIERIKTVIDAEAPWLRRDGMKAYLDEQLALIDTDEKLEAVVGKPFADVAAWAKRNGIPASDILLGEFGMIRQEWGNPAVVPAATRAAYYRDMIAHAERYGFAWSMWGYGGAFGVVEEFEGRPAEPDVVEMIRELP